MGIKKKADDTRGKFIVGLVNYSMHRKGVSNTFPSDDSDLFIFNIFDNCLLYL